MISFINKNQFVNVLLLLPYTVALRAYSFLNPNIFNISEDTTVFSRLLLNGIGNNPLIHSILACLLCYAIAALISYVANQGRIFQKQNLYPSFIFVLLSSLIADFQVLSPALIASLVLVFFIQACMKIYRKHNSTLNIFNVGFFASLAILIYTPFTILVLPAFFGLLYFKSIGLKDVLKLISGAMSVIVTCTAVYYFFDLFSFDFLDNLGRSKYIFASNYWTSERIALGATICVFFIIGLVCYDRFQKKKIIDARKKIGFIFLMVFFLLPVPFLFHSSDIYFLLGLCVIISFIAGLTFDYFKNVLFTETIHLLLLVILFGFQFNLINL